ncbi:MAG: hypothetical protein AB1736_14720 [Chloroflexota bacterium]
MPARKAARPDGSDEATTTTNGRAPTTGRSRRASRAVALEPAGDAVPTSAIEAETVPAGSDQVVAAPGVHEDGSWIEADAVEVHQGAVGRVDATDVRLSQGAIGLARADRVSVLMGGVGAAMGREVSLSQGGVGSILAQQATLDQAVVRTLVAQEVEFRKPSGVIVLIAKRVRGDVRVLLDWRSALAFGAAFGLIAGLVGRGRRGR